MYLIFSALQKVTKKAKKKSKKMIRYIKKSRNFAAF